MNGGALHLVCPACLLSQGLTPPAAVPVRGQEVKQSGAFAKKTVKNLVAKGEFVIFAAEKGIMACQKLFNMCTITLTYDPDNVIAQQSLAALLATGQFITGDATRERLAVDYSDSWLYEDDNDLPIPSDRNLSLDELEKLVVADMKSIFSVKDAVQV